MFVSELARRSAVYFLASSLLASVECLTIFAIEPPRCKPVTFYQPVPYADEPVWLPETKITSQYRSGRGTYLGFTRVSPISVSECMSETGTFPRTCTFR